MSSFPTEDDLAFFADRFVRHWYRGRAHLRRDLQRFATTYRVPTQQRAGMTTLVMRALPGSREVPAPR